MPTLTITLTPEQIARIAPAVEGVVGLEEPATAADVTTFLKTTLKNLVRSHERALHEAASKAAQQDLNL